MTNQPVGSDTGSSSPEPADGDRRGVAAATTSTDLEPSSEASSAGSTPWPLLVHPVLAAIVPILMLWAGNVGEVIPATGLRLVGWGVVVGCGLYLLLRIALRRTWLEVSLVATPVALALSTVNYLPAAVPPVVRAVLAGLVPVVALAVFSGRPRPIQRRVATLMTVALGATAVANGGLIATDLPAPMESSLISEAPTAGGGVVRDQRDVWLIIPDRYANLEALDRRGIDGRDFTAALEQRGFDVLDDATANYPQTLLSLASAWNLDVFDATGKSSPDLATTTTAALDDHAFGSTLQASGYEYAHLGSWAEFTAAPAIADVVLTLPGGDQLTQSWLETTVVGSLLEATDQELDRDGRKRSHARHQLSVMHELADEPASDPLLVLAHLILPHEPYLFAADGTDQPDREPSDQAYDDQRQFLDQQLLEVIDGLQARPEPPIIVIASDEGLYPQQGWVGRTQFDFDWTEVSVQDARDKLGILAAVYDPLADEPTTFALREDMSLVNIMRWLTNRAAGTELDELPDDHWMFRGVGPTNLQQVDLDGSDLGK